MSVTCPGPTLGVVGGGQLGRMLAEAAAPLGVDVVVLDPTPECPASRVAEQIEGEFDDPDAVQDLAAASDVLTIEIELADPDALTAAAAAHDVAVHPSPDALRTTRDKLAEKRALADAGVPVPQFEPVDGPADLRAAVDRFGHVMLKARTGGYDGRGNVPVGPTDDPAEALAVLGNRPAVAEAFVEFDRELSVIGVAGAVETRAFPAGENLHEEEILRQTVVPARTSTPVAERARAVALDVLELLEGRGVFGIELFEVSGHAAGEASHNDGTERSDTGGRILVNEIAPRPHNSGHWTIEGAVTSQFEQHVRAVLGWPLGATDPRAPTVMANILGDVETPRPATLDGVNGVLEAGDAHLHWYGKREARPLRKMGHVTISRPDSDPDALLAAARTLTDELTFQGSEQEPEP